MLVLFNGQRQPLVATSADDVAVKMHIAVATRVALSQLPLYTLAGLGLTQYGVGVLAPGQFIQGMPVYSTSFPNDRPDSESEEVGKAGADGQVTVYPMFSTGFVIHGNELSGRSKIFRAWNNIDQYLIQHFPRNPIFSVTYKDATHLINNDDDKSTHFKKCEDEGVGGTFRLLPAG